MAKRFLSNLRHFGFWVFSGTLLEYPARLIFTRLFQPRAFGFDSKTRSLIKTNCVSSSTCVDVGAYRGDILRTFLRQVTTGKVIAFEPDPDNYAFLRKHFPRADTEWAAVGNTYGNARYHRSETRPARNHLHDYHTERGDHSLTDKTISVPITSLDKYFSDQEIIDFIKIDVEGAELDVLRGGLNILRRSKPFIIIEHGRRFDDPKQMTSREIYQLITSNIGLDLAPLADSGNRITSLHCFLNLLVSGTDHFLATPRNNMSE